MSLVINMTNNCEWELAVLNDSVVFCFRVRNAGPGSWGSIPCVGRTFNRFEHLCLSPDGDDRYWSLARAQHLRMRACYIRPVRYFKGGEELIALKKNNHRWLD